MTNYDVLYRETKHVLGQPTKAFVDFFGRYEKENARVLDIGCGQGRDALFIARLGHSVTGIDLSPSGIDDLIEDAKKDGLNIDGIVADIRLYRPQETFDVILIDRTLHMLDAQERMAVLETLIPAVDVDGYVLIADEPKNIAAMQSVFDGSPFSWTTDHKKGGFLFLQRAS